MILLRFCVLAAFALLVFPAVTMQSAIGESQVSPPRPESVQDCDRLASDPDDPDVPVGVQRVFFERIDPNKAIPSCREAVAYDPGNARLLYQLGRSLHAGSDTKGAGDLYERAADMGYAPAMNALGRYFYDGEDVRIYDLAKHWYQRAIDAGYAPAMVSLGHYYRRLIPGPRDYKSAKYWYQRAIDAGYVRGYEGLALINTEQGKYDIARNLMRKSDPIESAVVLRVESELTPDEALDQLTSDISCDQSREFRLPAPNGHVKAREETKSYFYGSFRKWRVAQHVNSSPRDGKLPASEDIERRKISFEYVTFSSAYFSEMDPLVRVSGSGIKLSCRENNCFPLSINRYDEDGHHYRESETSQYSLTLCSPEVANRVARTIEFLIKANGG